MGFAGLTLACGRMAEPGPATPDLTAVARPLEIYHRAGLLAGTESFPGVASFATLAGPADSTYLIFGLSLPSRALRFHRDGAGFAAEYVVSLRIMADSQVVRTVLERETVRVTTFEETSRTDESVVFQRPIALAPGRYAVGVKVRDGASARGFEAVDTVPVPSYADGDVTPPVFVYDARGRQHRDAPPDLILNPRHTVPYGGVPPRLYVEAYGPSPSRDLSLQVRDERGAILWRGGLMFEAGPGAVHHAVAEVPPEILPLGRLRVVLAAGATVVADEPMLLTISDQWMVANFDDVLDFLGYIASPMELDSLRQATAETRHARWESFWKRRDPVPATPTNEFRDSFFQRVRIASDRFVEPGRPGWKTDRGEVYIVLGAPSRVYERQVGPRDATERPNALEWVYEGGRNGRLELLFVDRSGFGQYELTPSSELAFRSAARRQRPEG